MINIETVMALYLQEIIAQVNHFSSQFITLFPQNALAKQAINPADFSILKILDQSVDWLKSYGQIVNFLLTKS